MNNLKEINRHLIERVESILGKRNKHEIKILKKDLENYNDENNCKLPNKLYSDFSFVFQKYFPTKEKGLIYLEIWKSIVEYGATDLNKEEKKELLNDILNNISVNGNSYVETIDNIVNVSSLMVDIFNEVEENGKVEISGQENIEASIINRTIVSLLLARKRNIEKMTEEEEKCLSKGIEKIINKITELPSSTIKASDDVSAEILRDKKIIDFEFTLTKNFNLHKDNHNGVELEHFRGINEQKSPINKFNINDLSNVLFYNVIETTECDHLIVKLNNHILGFKYGNYKSMLKGYVALVYAQLNEKNFKGICRPKNYSDEMQMTIEIDKGKEVLEDIVREQKEILEKIVRGFLKRELMDLPDLINFVKNDVNNLLRENRLKEAMGNLGEKSMSIKKKI